MCPPTGRTPTARVRKANATLFVCIAAPDPESFILILYDSQPQTGIVQPFARLTLSQSEERKVWSNFNGD